MFDNDDVIRDTGYNMYNRDPKLQMKYFHKSISTTEFTLEEIRKMPIWAATIWNDYYVLFIATDGGTVIDEYGFLPEGMECIFVNRHNGSIRIASPTTARYYIPSTQFVNIKPLGEVPFDNLKIG